jgi:hypothetical protein
MKREDGTYELVHIATQIDTKFAIKKREGGWRTSTLLFKFYFNTLA